MDEFTELFEKSKNDHESKMIVGSEVRYIINVVRSERARITALETALARVERENTLLRAECVAWRAAEHLRRNEPHNEFRTLADARAATDAAKALGAEMPARKLPQAEDFAGEGRVDITGGIDSAEYVRGMRDGAKGAE